MSKFTEQELDRLAGLHVQRAWFAEIHLPSGIRRLHTGMGTINIGGHDWEGVGDPFGGQLVALGSVEQPSFGMAVFVDAVMSGANREFLKSFWDLKADIEGVKCDLYFATFDAQTGEMLIGLKKLFPGKLTAPRFSFIGAAVRTIFPRIVSIWEGLNFPATRYMWSPAGQRERYPGDKGLDFINSDIVEDYKK